MGDYSQHQKKIIDGYYQNRDSIMLSRLSELVSELYLAGSDRKRDQLWKRVETAMGNLKVKPSIAMHILSQRKPDLLAEHVADWMKRSGGG